MDALAARLERVEHELSAVRQRLAALEAVRGGPPAPSARPAASATAPPAPSQPPSPPPLARATPHLDDFVLPVRAPLPGPPPAAATQAGTAEEPHPGLSLEEQIGGQWLNWLGAAAVVIAVGFALKWGYDQGFLTWIFHLPRTVYVALGWLCGAGLLAWSERLRRDLPLYAQGLAGGGIAILYVTTYAGHTLYGLLGAGPATVGLALTGALAIALAVRHDSSVIGWLGIVLAYASPVLFPSPRPSPGPLFLYVTALNAGVLGVSVLRSWPPFRVAAFVASLCLYLAWHQGHYSPAYVAPALTFIGTNGLIFLGVLALYPLVWRRPGVDTDLALAVLNPIAAGAAFYTILNPLNPDCLGLVALGFAAIYWGTARAIRLRRREEDYLEQLFFGISLTFAVLAVPLQFHGRAITAGWALLAAALSVAGYRTGSLRTRMWGVIALGLSLIRLAVLDAWRAPSAGAPLFFNERGFSFAVVAAALGILAGLFAWDWKRSDREDSQSAYALGLCALTLCILMDSWTRLELSSTWAPAGWCTVSALALAFGWQLRCREARAVGLLAVLPPLLRAVPDPLYLLLSSGSVPDWQVYLPPWAGTLALCSGAAWAYLRRGETGDLEDRIAVPFLACAAAAAAATWAAVQLDPQRGWLSVAWLGILLALLACAVRTRRGVFRLLGVCLAALLTAEFLLRGLVLPAAHPLLLHSRSLAALAALAGWIACARTLLRHGGEDERALVPVLYVGANLLGLGWLSVEAWDVAGRLGPAAWSAQASQFGISAVWVLFAAAAIAVGFAREQQETRWGGLALLLAAVVKVFLFDLSFLGSGFRMLSCLVLGVVLLGVSYYYQQRAAPGRERGAV